MFNSSTPPCRSSCDGAPAFPKPPPSGWQPACEGSRQGPSPCRFRPKSRRSSTPFETGSSDGSRPSESWLRVFRSALLLASASVLWAQGGAQLETFRSSVDGSEQPYALYVPRGLDVTKKHPLLISLHSEDTNHRMNLRQVFGLSIRSGEANPDDLRYFPMARDAGFLVASPFARGTMDYSGISERDLYDTLADVQPRSPAPPDRLYLTGISMGGAAVLRLALTRPDLWAAVAAVCPAPVTGLNDLAGNALNLP